MRFFTLLLYLSQQDTCIEKKTQNCVKHCNVLMFDVNVDHLRIYLGKDKEI